MKIDQTNGERAFNYFNVFIMMALVLVTLYPMLHIALASVSSPNQLMGHTGLILRPLGFSLASYAAVFKNPMIITGYGNTLFVVVVGVAINILLTSMGAYFLSRKNIMLRDGIMFMIIVTMFFNGGLIPFYFTVRDLNLDNTLWSLILPSAINTFNLIIMRTAFYGIPDSLEESAKLDGAGHFTILFRIILPLSLPTVAVLVLYYGVGHWNAWFNAMLFLRKRELWPLQLVLREVLISNDLDSMATGAGAGDKQMIGETIKYAIIVIATLPILALYPFLQKYFVKGVLIGAVKG
jgi:putative aldouronate transport system permease protein